jgi:hypothetical protein
VNVIETKVSLPAIVTGLIGLTSGSIWGVLLAYDWVSPSPPQAAALTGLGAALLYVIQTVLGYLAPHTARTDAATADAPMVAAAPAGGWFDTPAELAREGEQRPEG